MNYKILIPVITLAVLIITILLINIKSISKLLNKEIALLPAPGADDDQDIITLDDIKDFPGPIRRYLNYAKVIGKKKINNVKIEFEGDFRMSPEQKFMKIKTVQYNDINNITRHFFIKARMMGFMVMTGKDVYKNGHGRMTGKLMHFFTIFDEKGKEFDIGELVTFLNDMLVFYPSGLINLKNKIKWKLLDNNSVQIIFTDNNITVKADLHFNKKGGLANFYTTDRFLKLPKWEKYKRTKWSTPVEDYKTVNGRLIPNSGNAIWHLDSGEFCYARFKLKNIEYDVR